MLDLSKALPQILQQLNLGERLREGRIMDLWADVVGPTVAERSRPVKCRDGILTVAVSSSVWLQQLTMMRRDIVRMFAERIGPQAITDIQFTALGWSERPADPIFPEGAPRPNNRLQLNEDLQPPLRAELQAAVAQIPDEALRERASRMLKKAQLRQDALKAKGWLPCRQCGELHDRPKPLCIVCDVAGGGQEKPTAGL